MSVTDLRPASAPADDNPYKLVARYRKARKIANVLNTVVHATPENVEALAHDDLFRAMAARLAETRVPSVTTMALVVELLAESG